MKTLYSFVSVVVLAVASSVASAAPIQLTSDQMDNVSAGGRTYFTQATAAGGGIGLGVYSSSGTSSTATGHYSTSSAGNTSFAFLGAVVSSASSAACSGHYC